MHTACANQNMLEKIYKCAEEVYLPSRMLIFTDSTGHKNGAFDLLIR
jgi:hypothetical protein